MPRLLFICGFPGGGTDLLRTVLNVHPDIYISDEMPFLKHIANYGYHAATTFSSEDEITALKQVLRRLNEWNTVENLGYDFHEELKSQGKLTLEEVLRLCVATERRQVWGNKTPQNTEAIDLLHKLFPTACFLIVTRDVRDVCLSWRNKWGKNMTYCAHKWATRMKLGWGYTARLPQRQYLYVRFEDVLSHTEATCRKMCEYLGVPFSARMLEHHKFTKRVVGGKINFGKKIRPDNMEKWKSALHPRAVRRIEEVAWSTMRLLGYEPVHAVRARPLSTWELCRGVCHDAVATLCVGNRASQKNTMGYRLNNVFFQLKKGVRNARLRRAILRG